MTDTKLVDNSRGVMAIGPRRRGYSLDRELMQHLTALAARSDGNAKGQKNGRTGVARKRVRNFKRFQNEI